MDQEQLMQRFDQRTVSAEQQQKMDSVAVFGRALSEAINTTAPESRETSLALTRLEEAVMWANKAISRDAP